MEGIKSCPFCHCKAKLVKTETRFGVECGQEPFSHNMTRPTGDFKIESEAVEAWNFWVSSIEQPKPCPFCGEKLVWKEEYGFYEHPWGEGQTCILTHVGYENGWITIRQDEVKDWNRRAAE